MVITKNSAMSGPLLDPKEEEELIRAWQLDHDEKSRDRLVRAYFRLCYSFASRYSDNPEHQKDFAQAASMGILRSLDKFDPSRGVRFSTYSTYWIRNYINAMNADVLSDVSIPDRLFQNARMGKIPTGTNDAAVAATRIPVALDSHVGDDNQELSPIHLESQEPNPERVLLDMDDQRHFTFLIEKGMSGLNEREQAIVYNRRLRDPPLTLNELSEHFGVTRERIRQIEKGALIKMKEALGSNASDSLLD